jgi:hypothetical protein
LLGNTKLTAFQKLTKSFDMVNSSGDNTGRIERREREGGAGGEREGGERKRTGKVVQDQFLSWV